MNNHTNDGGPAFPISFEGDKPMTVSLGISIRDYFAASALQGMNLDGEFSYQTYATDAYLMADAMLKAREVKP
jgi:hypothetical protein